MTGMPYGSLDSKRLFLIDPPLLQPPAVAAFGAGMEFGPDALVGPVVDVVGRVALEVHALHGRGARADQHEAAVALCVDQLVAGGRRFAQDAEPAAGIGLEMFDPQGGGDGLARRTMETVAAGDEVALDDRARP